MFVAWRKLEERSHAYCFLYCGEAEGLMSVFYEENYMKMRAAVYHGPRDLRVEEVPVRELAGNEVMIKVKYCGVCGTDVHIFNGDGGAFAVNPPLVPGHEFSGIVEKVGEKVTQVQVGDHVTGDPNDMCGECYFCKNKMQHFCTNNIGVGTTVDGGFAEYVIMREKQVYKVDENLSFIEAAMSEPISCCLNGIDLCDIKAGDTVLVLGGGPIGMIMLQLAKFAGASKLILSEPVQEKRELAMKLGATKTIDPLTEDVKAVLDDYCENVDCVIECVGNIHTQEDAVNFAGNCCTVMFFGLAAPEESFPLKPDVVFKKELKITSSFINPYTFKRAVSVLESKRLDLESIITDIVPLEKIADVFTEPEYRRTGKIMISME